MHQIIFRSFSFIPIQSWFIPIFLDSIARNIEFTKEEQSKEKFKK